MRFVILIRRRQSEADYWQTMEKFVKGSTPEVSRTLSILNY